MTNIADSLPQGTNVSDLPAVKSYKEAFVLQVPDATRREELTKSWSKLKKCASSFNFQKLFALTNFSEDLIVIPKSSFTEQLKSSKEDAEGFSDKAMQFNEVAGPDYDMPTTLTEVLANDIDFLEFPFLPPTDSTDPGHRLRKFLGDRKSEADKILSTPIPEWAREEVTISDWAPKAVAESAALSRLLGEEVSKKEDRYWRTEDELAQARSQGVVDASEGS